MFRSIKIIHSTWTYVFLDLRGLYEIIYELSLLTVKRYRGQRQFYFGFKEDPKLLNKSTYSYGKTKGKEKEVSTTGGRNLMWGRGINDHEESSIQ